MFELLFVMALTLVGVLVCVLGVGMASGNKSETGKLEKAVRTLAMLYRGAKRASNALDEDFLSKKQAEQLFLGGAEMQVAANDTKFAAASLIEPVIGTERTGVLFAAHEYLTSGKIPKSYLDREEIRSVSGLRSRDSIYGALNYSEERLVERGREYAITRGLDPGRIEFYFSKKLNNKTNRAVLEQIGNKYHIGVARNMAYTDQLEAIFHEIKHIELEKYNPDHTEADVHAALFGERYSEFKGSDEGYRKRYGEIVAQMSYIRSLERNPGTYHDEFTGTTERYADIAKEFKIKSPEGKKLLENPAWQKEIDKYESVKRYSGLT